MSVSGVNGRKAKGTVRNLRGGGTTKFPDKICPLEILLVVALRTINMTRSTVKHLQDTTKPRTTTDGGSAQ